MGNRQFRKFNIRRILNPLALEDYFFNAENAEDHAENAEFLKPNLS